MHEKIIILDFGGQYAHLIASRIRRKNVLAEIYEPEAVTLDFLKENNVKGIILSGGPQSVFDDDSPKCDNALFTFGIPVLGLCYGHQYFAESMGGKVLPGKDGEFGRTEFIHTGECPLFKDIPQKSIFWMNHVDEVGELADGFVCCGSTDVCQNAAFYHPEKNLFGVQFHAEVSHSEFGPQLFENFLNICQVSHDWTIEKFLEEEKKKILQQVGDKNVFLFVSGGVDSTVSFAFLCEILGKERVKGLFVDTGLLRQDEVEYVEKSIRAIGADLTTLSESDTFLGNLKDVYDPEKKREIIGHTFLEVQQKFFTENKLDDEWLLAQGTIYPDTIETGGTKHASKIKTHHNRAPEVQKLIDEGKILEPIKELYKDEVRALGELLGLPSELVWRHPFPGPGLGVRILCSEKEIDAPVVEPVNPFTLQRKRKPFIQLPLKSVGVQGDFRTYKHPGVLRQSSVISDQLTVEKFDLAEIEQHATNLINHYKDINRCVLMLGKNFDNDISKIKLNKKCIQKERVEILQRADHIVTQIMQEMGVYNDVWQFPVVLIPVAFNGVGSESVILRPIDSIDAMSASVGKLPFVFFQKVTTEILKDPAISAVMLDVTSKPPGTIEWE
jgi:GMP synthase (glutamine-hydrolysing)